MEASSPGGAEDDSPLFVVLSTFEAPEDRLGYFVTTRSLGSAATIDISRGIEEPGGGRLYVEPGVGAFMLGGGSTPTITRYEVTDDGRGCSPATTTSGARARSAPGAALGWSSPGEVLSLDANTTWIELRNTSDRGPFADFEGDRIPNRPWLYANASVALRLRGVSAANEELTLTGYTNYIHDFFRSWESAGRRDYKLSIDAQLLHSTALTYLVSGPRTFSATFEVQNLTDERAYDFLGVQKPGRAYYFKGVIEL